MARGQTENVYVCIAINKRGVPMSQSEITYEQWTKKSRFRVFDRVFSLLERQE